MPVAQYVFQAEGIHITRTIRTPRRITVLEHWFRECRKAIPQIPNAYNPETGWRLTCDPDVSIDWVKFYLESSDGFKADLVINRKANQFMR